MSIIPVQEQWTIYVKGLTGEAHSFTIEKEATVRKLYRVVRRKLKATSSIKIILQAGSAQKDIPKSDERIGAVGMYNNCQLYVIVEQVPDMYKVTLNFSPPTGTKTVYIAENKSTADLFKEVKNVIAVSVENWPTITLFCGDTPVRESNNSLQGEIFDGIELNVRLVMMTVMVKSTQNSGAVRTVNISPDANVRQLLQKVREVVPTPRSNQHLRVILGNADLREDSTQSLQDIGIYHGSTVTTVLRLSGGSDPRITLLLECEEKVIAVPSLRACPHCGALVEHSVACKHMKCLVCGKKFCFICLSGRDERSRLGGIVAGPMHCVPLPQGKQIFPDNTTML